MSVLRPSTRSYATLVTPGKTAKTGKRRHRLRLVIEITESAEPFGKRLLQLGFNEIPVGLDFLVYTERELSDFVASGGRFAGALTNEAIWL